MLQKVDISLGQELTVEFLLIVRVNEFLMNKFFGRGVFDAFTSGQFSDDERFYRLLLLPAAWVECQTGNPPETV